METGTLSSLSRILSPVGMLTGSVDRLDLGKGVQGEGTKEKEEGEAQQLRKEEEEG